MNEKKPKNYNGLKHAMKIALPLLVLVLGGAVAAGLINTSPKIQKQAPKREARLVEVVRVYAKEEKAVVRAMGSVTPAEEVSLQPQVSGKIVETSREFIPGGRFKKGDVMLRIDPTDYELAVRQREAAVAEAQSDLKLEMGQQAVALREYELLGEVVGDEDRDFVLRKPQLEKARSALKSAKAALSLARVNLQRTAVAAPFDLIVRGRNANLGAQVTTSMPVATVVGTDKYWIEAPVPVGELKWVEIPESASEAGSVVKIFSDSAWGAGVFREARVRRLLGDLDESSRMARLIVEVSDPLSLDSENAAKPRLIIGSYVRVEIEGLALKSVFPVARQFVHNGGEVWIMNSEDELEIRRVNIAFGGQETLFIESGLQNGERLVTTLLSAPVEGMKLRTRDSEGNQPLAEVKAK